MNHAPPMVEANGLQFHVMRLGPVASGRPKVIMIHGLVVDDLSSYYYTLANAVALQSEVFLYDLRGHGRSSQPACGYRLADHIADLEALMDGWDIDEPVHLIGNSYGGLIALEMARLHPDQVASMMLIEAHFPIEGWGDRMAGTVGLARYGFDEDSNRKWLEENAGRRIRRLAMRAKRMALGTSIVDDLVAEKAFPVDAMRAISCPVLAVYGEGSDIVERGRDLERYIPGARLVLVPGAEHGLLHQAAAVVRDQAVGWIAGVTVVGSGR